MNKLEQIVEEIRILEIEKERHESPLIREALEKGIAIKKAELEKLKNALEEEIPLESNNNETYRNEIKVDTYSFKVGDRVTTRYYYRKPKRLEGVIERIHETKNPLANVRFDNGFFTQVFLTELVILN